MTGLPVVPRGTELQLEIAHQGPQDLRIPATIVYWIDQITAERVGNVSGAGIRFTTPIDEQDTAFGAAITCLLVSKNFVGTSTRSRRSEKRTQPITEPLKTALVTSMTVNTQSSDGRLVFTGWLAVIGVPELLTTLARRRVTGRLELTRAGVVGSIDLLEGDIVDVVASEGGDPRRILWTLLSWRSGSFRLLSTPARASTTTRTKVAHVLMEHLRLRESMVDAWPSIPASPR